MATRSSTGSFRSQRSSEQSQAGTSVELLAISDRFSSTQSCPSNTRRSYPICILSTCSGLLGRFDRQRKKGQSPYSYSWCGWRHFATDCSSHRCQTRHRRGKRTYALSHGQTSHRIEQELHPIVHNAQIAPMWTPYLQSSRYHRGQSAARSKRRDISRGRYRLSCKPKPKKRGSRTKR